jgi:hypothetical protein
MKIILSRKGFDSAAGKAPSPIIAGRPVSLPIPASRNSATTYDDLGLGAIVRQATRGRMTGGELCHHDPMFVNGECIFGQTGAAQSHLARQGVGPGDVFLFFGLFADEHTGERHHRWFGYLRVASAHPVALLSRAERAELGKLRHPHVMGERTDNDTIYRGEGAAAHHAGPELRLTRVGGPVSRWLVPPWLEGRGLTYHGRAARWSVPGELAVVARGQEFVCDAGDDQVAQAWAGDVIARIRG